MTGKYVPTTTHSAWGSGHPHLILSGPGDHREVPLDEDLVRIGSGADAHVRIDGLDPLHAEIHHDVHDEYVLVLHGQAQTNHRPVPLASLDGKPGEVLRTGARFVLGDWAFTFARDEYADHGLPYGGRQGGEGAPEPHQPPRPDYTGAHPVVPPADGAD
ncbi:FHA domain-containing protein [Microbacterium luticocti]|uniref:FHA domain-containing protein n=1 Tax=Microbacterium luticocti TaxID=451764 RepID=UPI00040F277D|nr:FHA domain-containing protein [Microbacterium luticocti]